MLQRGDEALLRVAQGNGAEGSRALSPRDVAERLRSAPRDEEGKKGGIPDARNRNEADWPNTSPNASLPFPEEAARRGTDSVFLVKRGKKLPVTAEATDPL